MPETKRLHHWASPSRLGRLAACPGSRELCEGLPEETTPEAERGIVMHAAIAEMFSEGEVYAELEDDEPELVARCVDWFRTHFPAHYRRSSTSIEVTMPLTLDGVTIPEYGTADVLIHEPERGRVTIVDWKTGRAEPSEKDLALQVAAYALCAMQLYRVHEAEVWIYMPRLDREYRGQHQATQFLGSTIKVIMERSKAQDAPRIPGPAQCAYCEAKGICPEALAAAQAMVPARKEDRLPADPAGRGKLLRDIKYAKDILETVEARIKADALEGMVMPEGFRVVTRKATPRIRSAREAFLFLKGRITATDFLDRCEVKLSALRDIHDVAALLAPVIEQAPPIQYLQATTRKDNA